MRRKIWPAVGFKVPTGSFCWSWVILSGEWVMSTRIWQHSAVLQLRVNTRFQKMRNIDGKFVPGIKGSRTEQIEDQWRLHFTESPHLLFPRNGHKMVTLCSLILTLHTKTYHNGMWQVAIGLGLQTHRVELGWHVALWTGLVQCSTPDFTQLGCNKKWQNTLGGTKKDKHTWTILFDSMLRVSIHCWNHISFSLSLKMGHSAHF